MTDETKKEIVEKALALLQEDDQNASRHRWLGAITELSEFKAELEAEESEFPFKNGDEMLLLCPNGEIMKAIWDGTTTEDWYNQGNTVRLDQRHLLEQRSREQRAETQIRHYCEKHGIAWEWVNGKIQFIVEGYDHDSDTFSYNNYGSIYQSGVKFHFDSAEIRSQVLKANRESFKVLAGVTEGE